MTTLDSNSGTTTSFSDLYIALNSSYRGMPARNETYLEGDERGHTLAKSLGGSNDELNVRPQASDLNHGSYYQLEEAERSELSNGAKIESERIASSTGGVGSRPEAYMVNDSITYADGNTQQFHFSAANLMNSEAEAFEQTVDHSGYWELIVGEYDNPGDSLRDSMSVSEYAALMTATDAELPSIAESYLEADFSGLVDSFSGSNSGSGFVSSTEGMNLAETV